MFSWRYKQNSHIENNHRLFDNTYHRVQGMFRLTNYSSTQVGWKVKLLQHRRFFNSAYKLRLFTKRNKDGDRKRTLTAEIKGAESFKDC